MRKRGWKKWKIVAGECEGMAGVGDVAVRGVTSGMVSSVVVGWFGE